MSARALAWAWRQSPRTTSQKLVLAALADRADDDGECYPSIQWISLKCDPMTKETVRRCIRELTEQGFVVKVERNRRPDGTLGTWTYQLPIPDDDAETSVHERTVGPVGTGARADLDLPDGEPEARASGSLKARHDAGLVTSTWLAHAPPLMQHRPNFLNEHTTRKAVERALRVYDAVVIGEAIANYATVLGESNYRWSHSWTLPEFLKRGLDRFVPEARPLENFRIRSTEKFGRRDVSSRELLDLADRLESEDQQRAID